MLDVDSALLDVKASEALAPDLVFRATVVHLLYRSAEWLEDAWPDQL